jgi:hypothetical protein
MTTLQENKSLTIVVISSLTSYSTAGYLLKALIQEGHKVFAISDKKHSLAQLNVQGAFDLPEILSKQNIKPNLVLFIEGGSMQLFPHGLNDIECLTAWYGIDTHMNYEKHLRISRLFDVTLVAQKEYVIKLISDGIRQVIWLPLAFEQSLHPSKELERIYDIGYVGSNNSQMHPARHKMLAALAKHFPRMWSGMATPKEMGKIYAQSKLVFNKSINNDLNMRYFEAMGAGAVLITDPILNNGVEQLFEEGKHFLNYHKEEDLIGLVSDTLSKFEKMEQISLQARTEVVTKHTYLHRAQEILNICKECKKLQKPHLVDYFPVLISLGMSVDALAVVRNIFDDCRAGRRQTLINSLFSSVLGIILIPSRLITAAYRFIWKN